MSYLKQPSNQIRKIWGKALEILKKTDELVIIGCSLREEDEFLRFALYHFGTEIIGEDCKKNGRKDFKINIEIVDKGEDRVEKIKSKLEKIIICPQNYNFKIYNNGLEGYLDS